MSEEINFDPFMILGVGPTATDADIKKAYRSATKRFHPDVNKHPGAILHFRDVVAAYEILSSTGDHSHLARRGATGDLPRFTAQTYVSKRTVGIMDEPQVVYVLMEIMPRYPEGYELERSPLNLGIALDRSASMKGARMNRVKVAARQILDQLTLQDRLCVVAYSDRAEVLLPSQIVKDVSDARARINMITPGGGTEIYQGLKACYDQIRYHIKKNVVSHIILLTDGRTYGDENLSLDLADEAREAGVGISAMGIGDEWNDIFLDALASRTGGASAYINSPTAVVQFLEDRVSSLGQSFAERLKLTIAPDHDIVLESAFRLSPIAQPLDLETQPMPLGALEGKRPIRILLQFQMPASMKPGFRSLVRMDAIGDILVRQTGEREQYRTISDQSIEVTESAPPNEKPPPKIMDALSKLTLYRMQQKVEEAVSEGEIMEATRRLRNLATRLLEMGQTELASKARVEATRILKTRTLSEEGRKSLKFGTRLLLAPPKEPLPPPSS